MPERVQKLRATLAELEQELRSLDTVDDETRAVLESAAAEIHGALRKESAAELEPGTLAERLKLAVQDFEAEHPTLANAVNRVIDGLGQMGI